MSRVPPLLPEEVLTRVLRMARFDGYLVLSASGFFAVLSALNGDVAPAIVGLLVAGAGAIELHGATLLDYGDVRGLKWLVWSQLFLMATVLAFCQYGILYGDTEVVRRAITDDVKIQLAAEGVTVDEFVRFVHWLRWMILGIATILYQGIMALYYVRRREAVAKALEPIE